MHMYVYYIYIYMYICTSASPGMRRAAPIRGHGARPERWPRVADVTQVSFRNLGLERRVQPFGAFELSKGMFRLRMGYRRI